MQKFSTIATIGRVSLNSLIGIKRMFFFSPQRTHRKTHRKERKGQLRGFVRVMTLLPSLRIICFMTKIMILLC